MVALEWEEAVPSWGEWVVHPTQGAGLEGGQGAIMEGRGQKGGHPERGEGEEEEAAATLAEELVICAMLEVQMVWAGNC